MNEPNQPDYRTLLMRSLAAIDQLEAKLVAAERARTEPIAIVGMGCRFPGNVDNPAAYWDLLRDGIDAVTEVPRDRWDADATFDPDPDAIGKSYTKWGGFIRQVDGFDTPFFSISPREAAGVDPQHRLLLEVTWEALEHASIAASSLMGTRAAVYIGISTHDYANQLTEFVGGASADAYTASGSAHSIAAGRLSYFLGVHGPNLAVDTACSSSLVAIHLAVQALRNQEASLALAGGVNLTLTATGSILTSRARMMSFDGRCKTFDASADGYVRAEGCGMLVLKRLTDAQREGDRILAVIRGSAMTQDGRSSGLTAPNGLAQEMVIRAALANAGLSPSDISVVEAHGTGTSLGDPIEVNALGRVFGGRDPQRPLLVGSVKTNIGHTEAAAGAASVIKTVLALQHQAVPPHLHFRTPNPLISWSTLPIRVPVELTEWQVPEGAVRRAGVSSFGFSGTNAHLVLEEAAPRVIEAQEPDPQPGLLAISALTAVALREHAVRFRDYLERPDAASWRDVVFTAGHGRSHFSERLAIVADDRSGAAEQLAIFLDDRRGPGIARGRASSSQAEMAFLFTGQGAQFFGMARGLYNTHPVFRDAFDACAAIVDPMLPKLLAAVVMADESTRDLLDDTAFTQPALFAVEYGLSELWRSWGIEPTVVMGHSVGEYVAACVAGVFSLEDGLRLIAHRGRLMSALPRDGSMAAVFADEPHVRKSLSGFERDVSVAAVNGPENVVISGRTPAVDAILSQLTAAGVEWQRLNVSHAFHSPLMDTMLDSFEQIAATVTFAAPRIGLVSNVTGRMADSGVASASYWRRHVREAVRFSDGIATLHAEKIHTFLEIGPSATLLRMGQRCLGADDAVWLPSLRKDRGDADSMLETLGNLYVLGQPIDWRRLAGQDAHGIELPTYPFQREHYWHDLTPPDPPRVQLGRRTGHPLLGDRLASPLNIYQTMLSTAATPWLADHRIYGLTLFPVTGFLELALAAARDTIGTDVALEDVAIRERLVLPEDGSVTVQVVVTPTDGAHAIDVYSTELEGVEATGTADGWRRHASAKAVRLVAATPPSPIRELPEGAIRQDVQEYYRRLQERGALYGPAFRCIEEIAISNNELLGLVRLPPHVSGDAGGVQLHPALLDACLQLVGVALPWDPNRQEDIFVPIGVDAFRIYRGGVSETHCHAILESVLPGMPSIRTDVTLFDHEGSVIAELRGLEFTRVTQAAIHRSARASVRPDWLLEVEWQSAGLAKAPSPDTPGRWLILSDGGSLAGALTEQLALSGSSVAIATHADGFARRPGGWDLDTADAAHYRRLLEEAAQDAAPSWRGIVSLLGVSRTPCGADDIHCLQRGHLTRVAALLAAIPALADVVAPFWLVTRGAQAVAGSVPSLAEAPAWGLGGVIAAEYPAMRTVRVDLGPAERDDDAELLAAVLMARDEEDRNAFRGGQRYVARLVQGTLASAIPQPVRLEIAERGVLENLTLRPAARLAPGPGELEIRVVATGLNFRDVLNALGMYPGDPGPLGNECSGVVTAVGDGVEGFAVGDEVVTMIDQSFATFVVAPVNVTVHKPASLTFTEAATIPVTFLTAEFALSQLGHMKTGDRVLIHAATGGVGMAAMQLARRAGAEIFATAGSPAKRTLARTLGAHHVGDSRSTSFVEEFGRSSGGAGMDIVLNSLAGDFIPSSLGLLRSGGHFIEIGKTGIWDRQAVNTAFPGVEYHPLYLGEVAAARPIYIRDMLQRLMNDFDSGALTPLPQTLYPIERAEDAFRYMGQGRHTGKIVITQRRVPEVRTDATYLVTGGLGGLGLACARGLASQGARHIVLTSRRAPSDEALAAITALENDGVSVTVGLADVGVASEVEALVDRIRATLPPLRGILHAAGVVDDGMLAEQDLRRFERVMAPKVKGTWYLHSMTRRDPLDFFVMFSSGAALLGSPGQSNYAAANSFMDALAFVREAEGRHALSINWGSWSDVGMAAEVSEHHRRRWAEQGLRMIRPSDGVRMLEETLRGTRSPQAAILPLDRARLPPSLGPFFSRILEVDTSVRVRETSAADRRQGIVEAAPEDRVALVRAFLTDQLVKVLAVDRSSGFRTDQSLMDMGLDSLMAMELRNRVQSAMKVRLSVADLLAGLSADKLTIMILEAMDLDRERGRALQPAAAWEEGSL